jgi:hypothetical protein
MNPRLDEVAHVASHDMQPVAQRRRRNEAVAHGDRTSEPLAGSVQLAPHTPGVDIDRQDLLGRKSAAAKPLRRWPGGRSAIPRASSPMVMTLRNTPAGGNCATRVRTRSRPVGRKSSEMTHVSKSTLTARHLARGPFGA